MIHRVWSFVFLVILTAVSSLPAAAADRIDMIQMRDRLVVGVKGDYPNWGFRNNRGQLVGLEIDLAKDLADRLGVDLDLRQVQSANRLQLLENGNIDVVIATMGDNETRREAATLIEPHYYSSGLNILSRSDRSFSAWEDLDGRKVCAKQGAYSNKTIRYRYGPELLVFKANRDALSALEQNRCVAWLYDDTAIAYDLTQPRWRQYEMPLPTEELVPWTIGIQKEEGGGPLHRFIQDTIGDWHRTGFILQLQDKWNIQRTDYLEEMNRVWSATDAAGNYVCQRGADGDYPIECLYVLGIRPIGRAVEEASPVRDFLEANGINLTILFDEIDQTDFIHGFGLTLQLSLACLVASVVIGLVGALALRAPIPPLRWVISLYVTLFRATPPLVHILLFYFGVSELLPQVVDADGIPGPMFGSFFWATVALSLYAGSPNVIIFRSAMDAVPKATVEAAEALGMSDVQVQRYVVLPLAMRLALPAITANLINIVKATGIAMAIALPELLYVSNQIISEEQNGIVMMNVLLVTFFVFITILAVILDRARRSMRVPGMGA